MQGNLLSGMQFFMRGLRALRQPGIKRYVFLPLLFNALLMATATYFGSQLLSQWITELTQWLPSWLSWLYWILLPIALLTLVLILSYSFSTVLVVLLAPFCGLLSEQVDKQAGLTVPDETTAHLIRRTLRRELTKLGYLLPRYLLLLVLSLIPAINLVAPFLWFVFAAWVAAIQYVDYSFDSQQLSFKNLRQAASGERLTFIGFGSLVVVFIGIPVLNWVVIPAAVIGGTLLSQERALRTNQKAVKQS